MIRAICSCETEFMPTKLNSSVTVSEETNSSIVSRQDLRKQSLLMPGGGGWAGGFCGTHVKFLRPLTILKKKFHGPPFLNKKIFILPPPFGNVTTTQLKHKTLLIKPDNRYCTTHSDMLICLSSSP